jgi:hypothetical protein
MQLENSKTRIYITLLRISGNLFPNALCSDLNLYGIILFSFVDKQNHICELVVGKSAHHILHYPLFVYNKRIVYICTVLLPCENA